MNSVIQTVGAVAGLVSLVAVILLAMLNFSQARDIRRLREWAGGAPERDAEVRELSEIVAEERSDEIRVQTEREERRLRRDGLDGGGFWSRMGRSGQVMIVVAALLLAGTAAALIGTQVLGGDDAGTGNQAKRGNAGGNGAAALKPAQIKVGVLNGTGGTEAGLAASYADVLEGAGYSLNAVTNATEVYPESVIMYSAGNKAAARKVGKLLSIDKTEPMSTEVADVTVGATVTVVIGTDHPGLPTGG